jgi:ribosomal protein L12E/L44/L45/RPP1/RPP2
MDKLELVQTALRQLGDVSAQQLSAFIEKQHGVKIEPRFIPIFRASIREKERLEAIRQAARAAVARAKAEQAAKAAKDQAA